MTKKRNNRANKIMKNRKINKLIIIGIIVSISLVIGFAMTNIKILSNANASVPIDGIKCEAMESTIFHIHVHLDIFINGQNSTVPALIGITNSCFYWLHTHDDTGIIHIESPVNKTFTLGQFFDILEAEIQQ